MVAALSTVIAESIVLFPAELVMTPSPLVPVPEMPISPSVRVMLFSNVRLAPLATTLPQVELPNAPSDFTLIEPA